MIIGKDSALKGFSLFALIVLAIVVFVACLSQEDSSLRIIGTANILAQGTVIYLLYNKWKN